jgi:hypothetical protein
MAETVVIADNEGSGFRFSWGLAIAGGVVAAAVTFFLLVLGSGFGLLLVNPLKSGAVASGFLTGGAIYFLAAQAFGFAVGGHLTGRLLGPLVESRREEEIRAAAHGLVAWAVTVLATLALVIFAGLAAVGGGIALSALYGAHAPNAAAMPSSAYLVDVLFRPGHGRGGDSAIAPVPETADRNVASALADPGARAEAGRIVQAGPLRGESLSADDRARLIDIVSGEARIARNDAAIRVDRMQVQVGDEARAAVDAARRAASHASLWVAFSLLFGALVAVFSAISARLEDDREA